MKGTITARIEQGLVIVENDSSVSNQEKKEMDHLQMQHLEKIRQLVDANERCMDLLVNQNAYIVYKEKEKGEKVNKVK